MIIRKAFKFQFKTNPAQDRLLNQAAGCCRFVWNKALALQKERLDAGLPILKYTEMAALLVEWKTCPETEFLNLPPSQPLQQVLKNLARALKDAFNKKSPKQFPQFKKRGKHDSFRYPQGFEVDEVNQRVKLPKIGWVSYRKSQGVTGVSKNVTISRICGEWYVSIQTESEIEQPHHPSVTSVGVDLGIAKMAVLSDGMIYEPINSFRRYEQKLARLQRELSRKVKFSSNWQKLKRKIAQLHHRIANLRMDYLHKTSTQISKNHAMIVIEDLQVSNMSRSAKGTPEEHGKNVKAKSGLNKSILDQGWYEFGRQLTYKQMWRGGILVKVPPQYTSQRCSVCGYTSPDNRKTQSHFVCQSCAHTENADVNAAKNIAAAGHAVFACGGSDSSPPLKQEPAERVA